MDYRIGSDVFADISSAVFTVQGVAGFFEDKAGLIVMVESDTPEIRSRITDVLCQKGIDQSRFRFVLTNGDALAGTAKAS